MGDIDAFWEKYDPQEILVKNLSEAKQYQVKRSSMGSGGGGLGIYGSAKKTPRDGTRKSGGY